MRITLGICAGFLMLFMANVEIRSQLLINEFVASNSSGGYYDVFSQDYPDWIELHNSSDANIDLSGFYLTDDLNDPGKWKIPSGTIIPARGFALFFADDRDTLNHANFKLSAEGESIGLSNRDKNLIDSLVYLPQTTNISMGRVMEDPSTWAYFPTATPNAGNTSSGYTGKALAPVLNIPAGFFDSPLVLLMDCPGGSAIRYTLDGSKPNASSTLYHDPLVIESNTVVNAMCLEEGFMNSDILTHTYFIGEQVSLPVFSFSMHPGLAGSFPQTTETVPHVEFFDHDRKQILSQDIGARITGLVGIHPMKSFSLYARSEYGENRLKHRFFKDKVNTSYKNLVLRNGGYQDYSYTYLRDGLIQSFVKENLDLEYQAYQPVVVFKNGSYHGLMNLREKQNEFYIENNSGVDKDAIDMLEYQTEPPIEVLEGDTLHFAKMMAFIWDSDLSRKSNMDFLETQMDVKNFLDYYILQIYCANADWPDKNSKIWRPKEAGGKWRWAVFDVDYGYGFRFPAETNMYEYLYNTEEPYYHNRPWVTVIFRKIMENERIRNYYLQRFNGLLNTAFHPDRAVSMVDSLKAQIEPEMERHIAKWGKSDYGIPSMNLWQGYCDTLYDFAVRRPEFARQNMMEFYEVGATVTIGMRSEGGTIYLNDVACCHNSSSGVFFKDVPLQIRAVADPGYEFVEWLNAPDLQQDSISFTPVSDMDLVAVFRPVYANILNGTFSEDAVLSDMQEPYVARGDLIIPAYTRVTLNEGVRLLMPEGCNIYVYGTLTIQGSEISPVVIDSYSGSWGGICLDRATGSSLMRHLILKNASTGGDPERFPGAISSYFTHIKLEDVVIENVPANPVFAQYSNVQVNNCRFHSLGSGDLINVKHSKLAVVENSVFMDSWMPDTDAIDFDDVENGLIRNNKIHNLVGENSDGIDIGEGSTMVEISGNLITNCSDKGISIGQASSMIMERNVIYKCNNGIAVKDYGSLAMVRNNTLVNNTIGISCYEKNLGSGAGSVQAFNTIIAGSGLLSIVERNGGLISVAYSLSDTDILPGTGNLFSDPELAAAQAFNFELLPSSPCIDSGSPESQADSDGSRADIGAYFVSTWPIIYEELIINEYYSNTSAEDPEDWIEIYNKSNSAIDLSGWYMMDGGNSLFRIPGHTRIDSRSYLVVCRDTSNFRDFFGSAATLVGNFDFSLSKSRDLIALFDDQYSPVKSIAYDEDRRWPDSKDKFLLSVALIDTSLAITESINWRTGYQLQGTPGYSNIPPPVSGLYLNEFSGADQTVYPDEHGEYEDWIEIYNANDFEQGIGGLYLTDNIQQPALSRIRQNVPDSTVIPAYGYGVLFADKDLEQGVRHLDFRLSSGGEELGLVQLVGLDTVILDHVVFGDLLAGVSLGRNVDGGVPWERQGFTPGSSNHPLQIEAEVEVFATLYPNPVKDVLNIRLDGNSGEQADIRIVNALGQDVLYRPGMDLSPGDLISLDLSTLQPGIYLVQIASGKTNCIKRIIVSP